MPFIGWCVLAAVGAAFVPGAEVAAALLVWLALAFSGLLWATGQTAELPAVLGVLALALFVRFLRLRVAGRLW